LIVLDENPDEDSVAVPLRSRSKGKVVRITDLRPHSVIKDEAIPSILAKQNKPTFITTNVRDFWRKVAPNRRYCFVLIPLPNDRQREIPDLVVRLFRHPQFCTMANRMGKVLRVTRQVIVWYDVNAQSPAKTRW
jgi:hypothetical protein